MKSLLRLLFPVLIAASPVVATADGLDVGDDVTTTVNAQPMTWEPMLTHFSVASAHSDALVKAPTTQPAAAADVIGEANQWLALKPNILPHKGSFRRDESVLCAWTRQTDANGVVQFVTFGSGPADGENLGQMYSIFFQDHELYLSLGMDILMNATATKKDEVISQHFTIKDLEVKAFVVTKDTKDFRAAVDDNAPVFTVIHIDRNLSDEERAFAKIAPAFRDNGIPWNVFDGPGQLAAVFEFRVKLTVEGRMDRNEALKEKTVEGAVRIALVNDRTFEILKLSGGYTRVDNPKIKKAGAAQPGR